MAGACEGQRERSPTKPPPPPAPATASRGLDSIDAPPRPLREECVGPQVSGNGASGRVPDPEGRKAEPRDGGAGSRRRGRRPGVLGPALTASGRSSHAPQRAQRKPRPACGGAPPSCPLPASFANDQVRLLAGPAPRPPEEAQPLWPDGHFLCPIKTSRAPARPSPLSSRGLLASGRALGTAGRLD